MNRLDFCDEIARRVPIMIERDKEKWERLEELRKKFVSDYTIAKIRSLSLQEYVIGSNMKKSSFCYRIERELDQLGRIMGSPARKFGVYYGREKGDGSEKRYRFVKKFGNNVEDAFETTKANICQLLGDAAKDDLQIIKANKLSPMFKAKLLFLYHPERFVPIYSEEHLRIFAAELNLTGPFGSDVEIQRAIADFRREWLTLKDAHPILFMRLLYDIFWRESDSGSDASQGKREGKGKERGKPLPLLEVAVKGAAYITEMPATGVKSSRTEHHNPTGERKSKWEERQRTGARGEAIVLALEKTRLIEGGRPDLAARIMHISQSDDSAGFDISSFEEDGVPRRIEVKATASSNLDQGFFISANELQHSMELDNYHLYIVFSALSPSPRVLRLAQPLFTGSDFSLTPVSYRASVLPKS